MKVLVVNAFVLSSSDPSLSKTTNPVAKRLRKNRGRWKDDEFVVFCRAVATALEQINVVLGYKAPIAPVCHMVNATSEALKSLVVSDWETGLLSENARNAALLFDSFDCVFIGSGSRKVLPWDPQLVQLSRLMHQCNEVQKPCFTAGFASFLEVATASLQGRLFTPLNGYRGGPLENLPAFPNCGPAPPAIRQERGLPQHHTHGFLDNETGDVYVYVDIGGNGGEWRPKLNVGLRVVSTSGAPTSARFAPRERAYAAEQRVPEQQLNGGGPGLIEFDREALVHIDRRFLQHPLVRGLGPQFSMQLLPEWHINRAGSLPVARGGFSVLGESSSSPVLLAYQHKTILAAEPGQGRHHGTVQRIMQNFVSYVATLMYGATARGQARVGTSLTTFLFGDAMFGGGGCAGGGGGGGEPKSFNRLAPPLAAPAIAQTAVRSALPGGPRRDSAAADSTAAAAAAALDVTMIEMQPLFLSDKAAAAAAAAEATRTTVGARVLGLHPASITHSPAKSPLANRALRRTGMMAAAGLGESEATREVMDEAARNVDDELARAEAFTQAATKPAPAARAAAVAVAVAVAAKPKVPAIAGFERAMPGFGAVAAASSSFSFSSSSFSSSSVRGSLSARLGRDQASLFLPTAHPQSARPAFSAPSLGDSSPRSDSSLRSQAGPTLLLSPVRTKPYTNYKKFQKLAATEAGARSEYKGARTDVYLSAHEAEIKQDHADRIKAKQLHPRGFQLGSPKHVIPLRDEGHVRATAPYPETPKNQGFDHMTAVDFAMLRLEDKDRQHAGYWKRY